MTTARDIRLSVIGEVRQYQAEMAKIPGITQREAARASALFARESTKAQAESAKAAIKAAGQAGSAWRDVGTLIGSSLSADAIKGAARGVYDFVGATMEARTEIIAFSKATSIGTDTLAGLQVAADRGGVSFEEIVGGVEDFGERLFDFSQGAGGAKEALELLGFTTEEIEGRMGDVDGVFRDVVDRMSRMEDGALKNTVAQQLFSDAGNRLNAVFADSTLEDHIALAERYGTVLDEDAIAATEEWNRAIADFSGVMAGATSDLVDFLDLGGWLKDFTLGFVFLKEFGEAAFNVLIRRAGEFGDVFGLLFEGRFREAERAMSRFLDTGDDAFTEAKNTAMEAARAFFDTTQAIDEGGDAAERQTHKVGQLSKTTEDAQKKAAAAAREHAKALREQEQAMQRILSANDRIRSVALDATSEALSAEEEIQRAYDERIDTILDAVEAGGSLDDANQAFYEAEQRRIRDLSNLDFQRVQDKIALERHLTETMREAEELRREAIRETQDAWIRVGQMSSQAIGMVLRAAEDSAMRETQTYRDNLNDQYAARQELQDQLAEADSAQEAAQIELQAAGLQRVIDSNEAVLEAERKKIGTLFAARQGLEAAGAIVSGAAGAAAALAPPPLGLGPVLGPALAVATISLAAIQATTIMSQPPPQFDAGFVAAGHTQGPDNYMAMLRDDESVMNQGARDNALGGAAGARALNETSGAMGGRGPTVVALQVGMRQLGRAVVDELSAGRELSQTMRRMTGRRAGVRPVYRVR